VVESVLVLTEHNREHQCVEAGDWSCGCHDVLVQLVGDSRESDELGVFFFLPDLGIAYRFHPATRESSNGGYKRGVLATFQ
jgi:hypothetical protein